MQKIITALSFLFISCFVIAQKPVNIKGVVFDTVTQKGLAYTTVSLLNKKDSTLINFTRADSNGIFLLKKVSKGNYLLATSYVGFVPVWKELNINESEDIDLGKVIMTDVTHLNTVVVEAKRPPVVMNNDTIEFNSENFKTAPNSVVEDLLKKLPGVVVDADGTIRVNGQVVNKVMVNGKEFFTGDPKMATKNLDAEAIDKIQVFDKKSDQSEFTGVDDGNSQKTINLKLKKDRNHAVFGRATGGTNFTDRYDAQANVNKFNGDQQFSFIGMANNTNRQGFSISDVLNFTGDLARGMRNGGGINIRVGTGTDDSGLPTTGLGQNQQGVADTYAGGLNYNDNFNNKKSDLNASVMASDIHLNTGKNTHRSYILPGNNYDYSSTSNVAKDINQQRFSAAWDTKIDSFTSLKITPVFSWQQQSNANNNIFESINTNNVKLNDGFNNTYTKSEGYNLGATALFKKKFKKNGRTLSSNINYTYNNSDQNGHLNSRYTDYTVALPKDSLTNQNNTLNSQTESFGGNVTYTEPVSKRSLIEFSSFLNMNIGESNKKTYDYNSLSGKYDYLNTLLSNNFRSNYAYTGGSINYRANVKKMSYTIGSSLQIASLQSVNKTTDNTIKQTFTDVLPNANLQYKFNSFQNIRFDYNTSTQQPSTVQLQPVENVSDPLNITKGNPNLKRSYSHNFMLNFFSADPATRKNFFIFIGGSLNYNAIVNADSIFNNGTRKSMPVNANGVSNLFSNASYGFMIRKLKSRVDVGIGFNYNHNVSFINGAENLINNYGINPSVTYNFGIDNLIDLQLNTTLRFSKASYSLQPELNTNYLTQVYSANITNYLPWYLIMNNNFNYTVNTGRAEGYNTKIPFWNISLAKSVLQNKRGEIKFSVYDLLNKNVGTTRSTGQNYIEDASYNVLQRYFLLTFTFSLNKAGKQNAGPNVVIKTIGN